MSTVRRFEFADGSVEDLAVEQLADGMFRALENPLLDQGFGYGDLFESKRLDDRFCFLRVIEPGRFRTLEFIVSREVVEFRSFEELMVRLEGAGGAHDLTFGSYLRVYLPEVSDLQFEEELTRIARGATSEA